MLFDFSEVEWVSKKTKNYNGLNNYGARISSQQNGKNADGSQRWSNCLALSHRILDRFDIKEGDRFKIGKIEKSGKVYVVLSKQEDGYTLCYAKKGTRGTGFVKFAHGIKDKDELPFVSSIEVKEDEISSFGDALFFQMPGDAK
jgi:hypothetical protein